jgi:dephospho-CoA kinase
VIGLVGGVGSGKSTLARLLCQKHPVQIVEGDAAGHHALTLPSVKANLRKLFGDSIFTPTGEIDRRQLSRLVFGSSPEQVTRRKQLEQIVHPRIKTELSRQIRQARTNPQIEAVILDAAILLETGWRKFCDVIVFVDVPLAQRAARVHENRGWSREQLRLREQSQLPLTEKRKEADYVVDNSGDPQTALAQLETIFQNITHTASR